MKRYTFITLVGVLLCLLILSNCNNTHNIATPKTDQKATMVAEQAEENARLMIRYEAERATEAAATAIYDSWATEVAKTPAVSRPTYRSCQSLGTDRVLPDPDVPENYINHYYDPLQLPAGLSILFSKSIADGYAFTLVYWHESNIMLWFEQTTPCRQILDAILLPALEPDQTIASECWRDPALFSKATPIPELSMIAIGSCCDKEQPEIDAHTRHLEVVQAWRVNYGTLRIEPAYPNDLLCVEYHRP
jgi:hypothetical protein